MLKILQMNAAKSTDTPWWEHNAPFGLKALDDIQAYMSNIQHTRSKPMNNPRYPTPGRNPRTSNLRDPIVGWKTKIINPNYPSVGSNSIATNPKFSPFVCNFWNYFLISAYICFGGTHEISPCFWISVLPNSRAPQTAIPDVALTSDSSSFVFRGELKIFLNFWTSETLGSWLYYACPEHYIRSIGGTEPLVTIYA